MWFKKKIILILQFNVFQRKSDGIVVRDFFFHNRFKFGSHIKFVVCFAIMSFVIEHFVIANVIEIKDFKKDLTGNAEVRSSTKPLNFIDFCVIKHCICYNNMRILAPPIISLTTSISNLDISKIPCKLKFFMTEVPMI